MSSDNLFLQGLAFFKQNFQVEPEMAAFAPGRANLIGEHTDYNDGYVLPFALPYKTIVLASKSQGPESIFISKEKPEEPVKFTIDGSLTQGQPTWANYVKGTIYQYLADLPMGVAINAVIVSNVPLGSGLSSSAALEVAIATLLEELFNIKSDGVKKALRCQKAEHTFANTPCGIMDQYISAMGQEGNLLLIDCRTKDFTLIPFGSGDESPVILVTNSNVKHELSGSEYPDRVRQCKEAVAILQKRYPQIVALRDATKEMLEEVKEEMSEVSYRRARHVIDEDRRTLATIDALRSNNYSKAGECMTQSHISLQNDYEVSCEELDFLVKTALRVPGVYGSRMTGGGFGGCTVTLVDRAAVSNLIQTLKDDYFKQFHQRCECYVTEPSAGAGIIPLPKRVDLKETNADVNNSLVRYVIPTILALSIGLGLAFILRKKN